MTNPTAHLNDWTLEQLAEGALCEPEQRGAMAHVEGCARCAAELEGYRALFAALSVLPRFAPSPRFSDAVLAQLKIAPQREPRVERLQRWLPTTRAGWALLIAAVVAPALPVLALVVWLFSQPLVSVRSLEQWALLRGAAAGHSLVAELLRWESQLGLGVYAKSALSLFSSIPTALLAGGVAVLAIGIPLSAWSLIRLVRTPLGNVTYAN